VDSNEKSVLVFRTINRFTIIGTWLAILTAVAVAAALSGLSITAGASALWLAVCVVPPTVMLMVWRGAPPATVAEILHAVDRRD